MVFRLNCFSGAHWKVEKKKNLEAMRTADRRLIIHFQLFCDSDFPETVIPKHKAISAVACPALLFRLRQRLSRSQTFTCHENFPHGH